MNNPHHTHSHAQTHKPADAVDEQVTQPEQEALAQPSREAVLEEENTKLKDQLLRSLAEAENTRRRTEREMDDTRKFAVSNFAREVLPVADNLRRALSAVKNTDREQNEALKALLTGVEATERQLLSAMDRFGIKTIETVGKTFDPNFHQVMFEVESSEHPPGTILQEMQTGYTIQERLLRPAFVGTAKAPEGDGKKVDTKA